MDSKAKLCTVSLCVLVASWFYWNLEYGKVFYEYHPYLTTNASADNELLPKDIGNLSIVINQAKGYIESTNAQTRLYDLAHESNFANPFFVEQGYSKQSDLIMSGWPVSNQTKCSQQLAWILGHLEANPDYSQINGQLGFELTTLMDSIGKPDSGLYAGVLTWLGSYRQCSKVTLDGGQIKTRYCFGKLRFRNWPKNERMYPRSGIRQGLCLPETCDTMSFDTNSKQAIERLAKWDLNQFYKQQLDLDSLFCLPDERSPIRQMQTSGKVFLALVALWVGIVLSASLVRECYRQSKSSSTKQLLALNSNSKIVVATATTTTTPGNDISKQHLVAFGHQLDGSNKFQASFAKQMQDKLHAKAELATAATGVLPSPPLASLPQTTVAPVASVALEINQQTANLMKDDHHHHKHSCDAELVANSSFFVDLLDSLSVRTSFKDLKSNTFRVRYNLGERVRVDLGCLDFIKVGMALLVILAHSGLYSTNYTRSLTNKIEMNTTAQSRLVVSVVRCVDTYFVFFGLLTTYTLMRKLSDKQLANPFMWIGVNVGIFLRIAPVFMLVYWYSRSVSPFTGAGPWWDYGVDRYTFKGMCRDDSWWKSIPYFANMGFPRVPACNLPGWFIVCYAQLSLILPLITYVVAKLPSFKHKFLLIGFMVTLSAGALSLQFYYQKVVQEEALTTYGVFLHNIMEKYSTTGYMSTLGKLGAAAIGCLAGYLLRMYELKQIDRWPRWLVSELTIALVVLGHVIIFLAPLFGYYAYLATGRVVSNGEFALGNFVLCVCWPILNVMLIIPATSVYNHKALIRFLSHSFWHAFNRLGLCMFLIHWEILLYATTNYEQAATYGFVTDVMKMWSFGIYVSIVMAAAVHVLFEAPISRLTMIIGKPFMKQPNFDQTITHKIDCKPDNGSGKIVIDN